MIQIALLLVLPFMCNAKILLNVTVASHINRVIVEYKGVDDKIVTDHEIELFNITTENLNRGMRVELGKAPDNIFLKDPTKYDDLFKKFKWPETKRNLRVIKADIDDLITKEMVLKTHEHVNNSTETVKAVRRLSDTVESLVYSSWSDGGLPDEDTFYDVIVNFGDSDFKYENKWRDRAERSTMEKIKVTKKGFISIKPGQTVVTELKAFKTIITIRFLYRAKLIGNLIGDYERLYGKYHFYSPTINNIMTAAGLNNEIDTTESLEIVCYSDPSIDVYDKDTGATVKSDFSKTWFKNLQRHKINT